jgi:hypothetical protein
MVMVYGIGLMSILWKLDEIGSALSMEVSSFFGMVLHVDHETLHGLRGNLEHAMVLGAGIRLERTTKALVLRRNSRLKNN